MDALVTRPHKRTRREHVLPIGGSGNPADFVVAIENVEAEVVCAHGRPLKDGRGHSLPSILDEQVFSSRDSAELLEAVRVMRGFSGPKMGIPTTTPFAPMMRTWDLDALESVFRKAVKAVAPQARRAMQVTCDDAEAIEDRIDAMGPASRALCLWSSLLHLAGTCAVLKMRYAKNAQRVRPGDA